MSYLILKHLHVTCVVLSGLGFCLRGWWMLRDSARLKARLAMSGQYPFVQGWLTAKLCGLLAYILLGMMALKRGRTQAIQARYFGLALLAYAYIVSVALTRSPLPGL